MCQRYDIYDRCGTDNRRRLTSDDTPDLQIRSNMKTAAERISETMSKLREPIRTEAETFSAGMNAVNDYECGSMTAMGVWLQQPSVRAALHVSTTNSGQNYNRDWSLDLRPLYAQLANNYQMLIYSGDVDACVPYVGTEQWTSQLGFSVVQDWHPWSALPDKTHGMHKAGYAITYSKLQFITVNGAGHLVPQTQPGYALAMFQKFLEGATF